MNNEATFSYTYSAPAYQEARNIRKKYMPQEESALEELKRLDSLVQNAGVIPSLCIGIIGCLIFGLGFCLIMKVIGNAVWLGMILEIFGTVGMISAFPVYKKFLSKAKAQHVPRILELADRLTAE